jgi:hypothetical protein
MNCFQKVINWYGLNNDSQGADGYLHALFSLASSSYTGVDTYPLNPAMEVAHRLRTLNPHVVQHIQRYLNTLESLYASGRGPI